MNRRAESIDRLGTLASAACAVHCFACALLPSALVALGLGGLLSHGAEWGFTVVAAAVAAGALVIGWPKHRSRLIVSALGVGIAGLLASRLIEEIASPAVGTAVGIAAGITLIAGHVLGFRAARNEATCEPCTTVSRSPAAAPGLPSESP